MNSINAFARFNNCFNTIFLEIIEIFPDICFWRPNMCSTFNSIMMQLFQKTGISRFLPIITMVFTP